MNHSLHVIAEAMTVDELMRREPEVYASIRRLLWAEGLEERPPPRSKRPRSAEDNVEDETEAAEDYESEGESEDADKVSREEGSKSLRSVRRMDAIKVCPVRDRNTSPRIDSEAHLRTKPLCPP